MRRVLITGAAQNLGASLARLLAQKGYALVLHYRTQREAAEELARELRTLGTEAETLQGDFSSPANVSAFVEAYTHRFSSMYGLINNVGPYVTHSALDTSESDWLNMFQTNLHAPFFLFRGFLGLLEASGGVCISIGSVGAGEVKGESKAAGYRIAKHGLTHLTRTLAREMASRGVRLHVVSPGHLAHSVDVGDPRELPLGRVARFEEVGAVVAFLLDPAQVYLTGQHIEVAGGYGL